MPEYQNLKQKQTNKNKQTNKRQIDQNKTELIKKIIKLINKQTDNKQTKTKT
jgi:hypothetical protein